jgi:hypothetical protein
MSRPAARLTSDLLARKGTAQPAAREEDLYRPGRPAVSLVELDEAKAARRGDKPVEALVVEGPAPEASLSELPISRPPLDKPALTPPPSSDAAEQDDRQLEIAGLPPVEEPAEEVSQTPAAAELTGEQPTARDQDALGEDAAEGIELAEVGSVEVGDVEVDAHVADAHELDTDEMSVAAEGADAEVADADADADDVDAVEAGFPEATVTADAAAEAELEPLELDDEVADAAAETDAVEVAAEEAGIDAGGAVKEVEGEIVDDDAAGSAPAPVIPPRSINQPTTATPRSLAPIALARTAEPIHSQYERRSYGSALTIFGLSAVVGVILAVIWLAANDKLPDFRAMFQSGEATETAPGPITPGSDQAPSAEGASSSDAGAVTQPQATMPQDDVAAAGEEAAAAAAAEQATADTSAEVTAQVPALDVVRIGEDGRPLLAGRAGPLARLVILDNDQPIGTAEADGNGEWVFQGDERVAPGRHAFSVAVGTPEATAAPDSRPTSNAAATVTVPEPDAAATGGESDAGTQAATGGATTARQSFDAALGVYYVVQLGSLVTEADAQRLWGEIADRHGKLIDGLEPVIQTAAQAGGGTIYRLRTGPFSSRQDARKLCGDFRKVGQDCLVVRREKTED